VTCYEAGYSLKLTEKWQDFWWNFGWECHRDATREKVTAVTPDGRKKKKVW